MKCTACKPCKHSDIIIKRIDEHLIGYVFFCKKYEIYGETLKELNENVKWELKNA